MVRKKICLLVLLIGTSVASYSIAARRSEVFPQTQRTASSKPTNSYDPRRFSELYSVTWEEIPVPQQTSDNPQFIWATSIANDGTIAGKQGDALMLWHPDAQVWERVPKVLAPVPVFISPDGSSVVATDDSLNILTWNRVAGWQALAGSTLNRSRVYNVSRNFKFAAGAGYNSDEAPQAWVWAIDGGVQQLLPTPYFDGVAGALATAVSDEGNVIIGNAIRPAESQGFHFNIFFATRWVAGSPPIILRDPNGYGLTIANACNADCSIVFGAGPWFLKDNGEFGNMGSLSDGYPWTEDPYGPYTVTDASFDGSLAVGTYLATVNPTGLDSEGYDDRPFLWTQATGMASLRSLGVGDDDWKILSTVRLSPDGRRVLISGMHKTGQPRAAVLHLTPRTVRPTGGHSTHATPTPPRAVPGGALRAESETVVD